MFNGGRESPLELEHVDASMEETTPTGAVVRLLPSWFSKQNAFAEQVGIQGISPLRCLNFLSSSHEQQRAKAAWMERHRHRPSRPPWSGAHIRLVAVVRVDAQQSHLNMGEQPRLAARAPPGRVSGLPPHRLLHGYRRAAAPGHSRRTVSLAGAVDPVVARPDPPASGLDLRRPARR